MGTTLAYAAVLAVVVPMASPAGSESLRPVGLAFAPIGIFLADGGYLSAVLLRLEHYFWPPFRSAASTIIGLGLSAFALVLTDNLVWVAVAVSTGYGVALLLLALELTHAVGIGPFMVPTRTALYAVIGMRGKFTTSVT